MGSILRWHVSANIYSYDILILNLQVRFVDRDMFMWYTHLGVGHPAMLRNITKDCLGFKSPGATITSNSNEADVDYEVSSDEECYTGCSDAEEESDEEISDDEMEDEDSDDLDDDLPSF